MRFAYLCDHLSLAPQLARAHYAEWSPLLPQWTEADALAELRTHRARVAIPTTMLALSPDGDDWIGSVSLLANDDDRIRDYSPWLASLYVRPEHRGHGHGIALVARCVQEASVLGIARLHLYTAAQQPFYEKLGWHCLDSVPLGNSTVQVMAIAPPAASSR